MLVIHLVSDWGGGSRIFSEMGGGGGLTPLRTMNLVILAKKVLTRNKGYLCLQLGLIQIQLILRHKACNTRAPQGLRWLWYRCLPVNFTEFLRTPLDNCFWRNSIREYWKCVHVKNWPTDRVRPAKWHFDSMEIIYLISNA